MDDLERCEICGRYVYSVELREIDAVLWCPSCIDNYLYDPWSAVNWKDPVTYRTMY